MEINESDYEWLLDDKYMPIIKAYNQLLEHIELELIGLQEGPEYPPIFIVGAPRCGGTFVYQALTDILEVGYISNFVARFWNAPTIGTYLAEKVLKLI